MKEVLSILLWAVIQTVGAMLLAIAICAAGWMLLLAIGLWSGAIGVPGSAL